MPKVSYYIMENYAMGTTLFQLEKHYFVLGRSRNYQLCVAAMVTKAVAMVTKTAMW